MLPRLHSRITRSSAAIVATTLYTLFIVLTPMAQTQTTKGRSAQKPQRASSRKSTGATERVDRLARSLNRATALALLKETSPWIRPKLNVGFALPLSGPQLTTPFRDDTSPAGIAEAERQTRLLASNLELYMGLVKAGFLTGPTSSLLEVSNSTALPPTTYAFEVIPEPDIEVKQSGNWERYAVFPLVQGSFTQVTGIYQDPGTATATVTVIIAIEPTQLYWRLKKVVTAISARQTLPNDSRHNPIWVSFPDVAQLYQTDTQQRTFVRYDDGWRCCR